MAASIYERNESKSQIKSQNLNEKFWETVKLLIKLDLLLWKYQSYRPERQLV